MVTTAKTAQLRDRLGHRPFWKRFTLCIVIAFLLCHLAPINTVTAATYYVDDANGNDTYDGNSLKPWKTLNRAYTWYSGDGNKVQEGDTVYFKNGNYGTFRENTDDGTGRYLTRSNWITYKKAPGYSPNLTSISIKSKSGLNSGSSYLKFDGFTIANGVSIFYTSNVQILSCTVHTSANAIAGYFAPYYDSAAISSTNSKNITIQSCDISECYRGIASNTNDSNWIISDNIIHHCSEDGFSMPTCNGLIISGNTIYDLRRFTTAMRINGPNSTTFTVGENVTMPGTDAEGIIKSVSSTYIYVYPTTGPNTLKNYWDANKTLKLRGDSGTYSISDVDPPHCDGFQIDGAATNIRITNNYINRTLLTGIGTEDGQGFKLAGPTYIHMENNLVIASVVALICETSDFNMINNTFWGPGLCEIRLFNNSSSADTIVDNMFNNIFSRLNQSPDDKGKYVLVKNHGNNIFGNNPNGNGGPSYPFAVNGTELVNYNINSLFVNAANNDFNLASGSVAINFGNPNFGPATDILGRSRSIPPDAGCYEYITSDSNNHAPVLETIGNKSVSENSLLSFAVSATDADGDTISYSAGTPPSGATFVGQTFSWTPGYNQAGTYPVTFRASDIHQATDSETIVITVSNTNRPPVLVAIGNKSVNEGGTLSFSISATDADGDTITYSAPNRPSGATLVGQMFSWTPGYNQAGTYQVTFIASDGQAQDSQTITITVNNVNRAPILSTIGSKSVYTNTLLAFGVNATDADGDTVAYSATGLPSGATFAGQNFGWAPAPSQAGTYQITFLASDSRLQDSEAITITVYSVDTSAPAVSGLSPVADSIQAPLNSLAILHVTDNGEGVDANSVTIKVNSNTVYTGNTADYSSQYGHCRRTGTKADYAFIYQPNAAFDYDQTINMAVNAQDLVGNAMSQYSYSFTTEMRSFGKNKIVNSGSDNLNKEHPVTVRDSAGDIWAAWHAGPAGSREVYVGKLASGADGFDTSVRVANNSGDKCNAVVAIDASDKLYLAWQDNRRGNWDIYMSTSVDGINWSSERRVTDSNNNAINPAIIVDHSSPPKAYIVWEDNRAGNQDIYIASSSNGFATETISRITSNISNQIEPAIAVNAANTVYVVWTDSRNSSSDIYGAASNNGPWTNVPIVTKPANQTSPAIATETAGAILHLVWVDDTAGNKDIYYATSNGLPTTPLTGRNIVDDSSGADQLSPAIITTGSTGSGLRVSACWQDKRNAGNSGDTDLYFVEVGSGNVTKTNIFVGDDATNSNQAAPVMGIDGHGYPYLLWADGRNQNTDIYYAGSTFVRSSALASRNTSPASGATIGADPAAITGVDDVSVVVPPGAYSCELNITISKVENPPKLLVSLFSFPYEFGPSGTDFEQPVTVTIPYSVSASESTPSAYWYDKLTGALSQQGITDVEIVAISPTLHALRFKTTHFTQFIVGGSSGILGGGGGGGGGGCALSSPGQASPVEFLLPYIGLAAVMIIINRRDRQNREIRRATGNMH